MNTKIRRKVLIAYGQDEEAKTTVAEFVENLGLKPIILDEKPNTKYNRN